MADAYQSIVNSLLPEQDVKSTSMRWRHCVQVPSEPDWGLYKVLLPFPSLPPYPVPCALNAAGDGRWDWQTCGWLMLTAFLLVMPSVYALRLRHLICDHYYPKRVRLRALHLYHHILKNRGGKAISSRHSSGSHLSLRLPQVPQARLSEGGTGGGGDREAGERQAGGVVAGGELGM